MSTICGALMLNMETNQGESSEEASAPVAVAVRESKRSRKEAKFPDFHVNSDTSISPKKKRSKKKQDPEEEFETVWICSECKEAECMMKPEADQLLICDGPCRRLFHYPCAGLAELPPEDDAYICSDCTNSRHACSVCQQYGDDNEDVFCCSRDSCGLFFHEACLAMQNVEVTVVQQDEQEKKNCMSEQEKGCNSEKSTDSSSTRRRFVCPAHWCWTCTQTDLKEQEKEAGQKLRKQTKGKRRAAKGSNSFDCKKEKLLVRCIECPIAYHVTCIPPTARFHELALLCNDHAPTCKLPDLDSEASIQSSIERKADEKYSNFKTRRQRARKLHGKNPFFPGVSGDKLTKREEELFKILQRQDVTFLPSDEVGFCLPCDLKNEVHSKPPVYHHVQSLKYNPSNRPTRIPQTGDICHCVGFCGDGCLNRMLYVECVGDASQDGAKKSSNCTVGNNCGNRKMGQRKSAKCKPVREQGKGWGLVTVDKILKGELIQEYVGEVIDSKEKEKRLTEWSKEHPNDPNFYIMALTPGWFIDARHEANLSRFINHSCDPNCVLLPINVGGYMRNGIFALRDIAPGEFLSYDYRFETRQGDRFVCRCGAKKCRGTMQGGVTAEDSSGKKSKSEIWEEAKARYERDKKFLTDYYEEEEKRRSQVAATVPSAENNDETVANGAQIRHRDTVLSNRIFLWRNAVQGSDFASRLSRLKK